MAILSTPFTRPQLVNLAIFVSIMTIVLNIAEGILSMFFGKQSNSVSLVIFGIGSFVEMTSSVLVLWRFASESCQETSMISITPKDKYIDKERKATLGIGCLFIVLALGTFLHSIISLTQKSHPDNTITFFSKEGIEMIYWANSERFDGGCNANVVKKVQDDVNSDDDSNGTEGGQIHVIGEIEVEPVVEKMRQEETRSIETKWWGNNGTDAALENGTRNFVKNDYENYMVKSLTIAVEPQHQQSTLN
ncbi:11161_t:CDS:2 [Racocetra fulgida]|uniref:11161_t:CDS:1 n=1 Tax=Racocetra fulgida TaxID=60492 RepID=A0A9N9F3U2_9GLOM|nr:11161_t:CDS:2 [Racocetra fulgida]